VTEIPEHLLKRSRERRSAIGGGGGEEATGSAPAAPTATPAASPAAVPASREVAAPVAAPPPKPDPPYIRAAKSRRKIPYWAMLVLALLPIWAFMYVRSVQDQSVAVEGPRSLGEEAYASCSGCHGGQGQGGSGRQLSEGEVLKTFPAIEDQLRWIALGTDKYKAAGVQSYGSPQREGGPHLTGSFGVMPGWSGELTDAEILAVSCYIRYDLGGADSTDEAYAAEYEEWCAAEAPKFLELEEGATFADEDFANVGTEPAEGRADPFPAGD
jgi:mono/diheme cytochrome c family protein